jgi:hypothetical protein
MSTYAAYFTSFNGKGIMKEATGQINGFVSTSVERAMGIELYP